MAKKLSPADLSDHALELIATRFKALSELSRLKLIIALKAGERNVSELVEATELTQANASRHLQMLVEAGILARRKEGLAVIYRIADEGIFDLCAQVCGGVQKRVRHQASAFTGRQ